MGCLIEGNKAQIITGFLRSECDFDSDAIALLEAEKPKRTKPPVDWKDTKSVL